MKEWMAMVVFIISMLMGLLSIDFGYQIDSELMLSVGAVILIFAGLFIGRWFYEEREEDV
ncbi:hypothetical protein LCGC14_0465510 [marine sediment metagenome]|uniref:Uncharacterized protein n=1 Tax=marine sediment metagenome TaxID=412755 RepID=A0A0F9SWJ1_9ZZZZ